MEVSIISPQFPFSGRVPLVPPILEYLAALTMRESQGTTVKLYDANQIIINPQDITSDLVAISVMTATAPWAYSFADECRKLGKKVVLGGIHPSALPQEALQHADSVVVGEAESIWGKVLADTRQQQLLPLYHGERLELDSLPMPIDGKLKGNYQFRAFFTMRGCPYRCTFCSVRRFFGDTIRYRPIAEVVAEVEACAGKLWFNGDDNIWGGDQQRSIALFEALAQGKNRNWYGFGDLRSIQGSKGRQMLAAARRSGLFSVWAGWENEERNLSVFNAHGKQGVDRIAAVKQMQDAGIDVTLFVVLGGRQDSIDSFKRTLELSERLQVGIHPVLLTPLPGTELYEEYSDFMIPGLGWEAFTGVSSVFTHPDPEMTPQRREEEYHRLSNELFRFERIVSRVNNISAKGFPSSHIYSFMMQVPMKHALSKAYAEWKFARIEKRELSVEAKAPQSDLSKNTTNHQGTVIPLTKKLSHCYWLAAILAVTMVDIIEVLYFQQSKIVDNIQILLFVNTFIVIISSAIMTRKSWYRHFDVIIDWSTDGKSRKLVLLRQAILMSMYGTGQYWGHLCAFHH